MSDIKIGICIPSRDTWKADFGLSLTLATLALWEMARVQDGINLNVRFCHVKGSHLAENRNVLVKQALDTDCTHILWVDDDMTFTMDTFYKLWKHDVDIVGANCATKTIPPRPTAKNGRDYVFTTETSVGLEEVNRLGMGVTLVKADVYKKIGEPYFACPPNPEFDNAPMGEDIYMIRKAIDNGYKVFIDHDVSKNVGHIGDYVYMHNMMDEFYGTQEEK